jgi:hypothetical protein
VTRSRFSLALAAALVAALTGSACGTTTVSPTVAPDADGSTAIGAVATATPDPNAVGSDAAASLAADPTTWLCKPGLADNPCAGNLDATSVDATGHTTLLPAAPAADPPIDCFYVYPTVSHQSTVNANPTIDKEERSVAIAQAAQLSKVCRVYAPIYRQLTLAAIQKPGQIKLNSALTAYGDVLVAFQTYMARYNNGRGIVFVGHSQGAMMLTGLLRTQVDPQPNLRAQLVSAILAGGNVEVPIGKNVGGDFANIPACTSGNETGCVVAWSSFDSTPPAKALFGRAATALRPFGGSSDGLQVLCVNPAAPGGGTATLEPYFPTTGLTSFLGNAAPKLPGSAPFVTYPDQFSAHCMTSGGASWLQIDKLGGTLNVKSIVGKVSAPTWGLHLIDISLTMGNIVDLIRSESAAFH